MLMSWSGRLTRRDVNENIPGVISLNQVSRKLCTVSGVICDIKPATGTPPCALNRNPSRRDYGIFSRVPFFSGVGPVGQMHTSVKRSARSEGSQSGFGDWSHCSWRYLLADPQATSSGAFCDDCCILNLVDQGSGVVSLSLR